MQDLICKFSKKGLTPSQIGVLLRDNHGIAQVSTVTGSKVLRILKGQGARDHRAAAVFSQAGVFQRAPLRFSTEAQLAPLAALGFLTLSHVLQAWRRRSRRTCTT